MRLSGLDPLSPVATWQYGNKTAMSLPKWPGPQTSCPGLLLFNSWTADHARDGSWPWHLAQATQRPCGWQRWHQSSPDPITSLVSYPLSQTLSVRGLPGLRLGDRVLAMHAACPCTWEHAANLESHIWSGWNRCGWQGARWWRAWLGVACRGWGRFGDRGGILIRPWKMSKIWGGGGSSVD